MYDLTNNRTNDNPHLNRILTAVSRMIIFRIKLIINYYSGLDYAIK